LEGLTSLQKLWLGKNKIKTISVGRLDILLLC
jgi:hypothetical protein